ncbi:hypothetical protein Barb6_02822 [Bacteroidales bacterium Barb6]|nr:hypothetical protein Barb6_02822 [Bacteroidales bacterium Barb6]
MPEQTATSFYREGLGFCSGMFFFRNKMVIRFSIICSDYIHFKILYIYNADDL